MIENAIAYVSSPEIWISFLTLSMLEIVLGIDNVIFISIVANRLNDKNRAKARSLGLMLALLMRVAFLVSIVWLVGMTKPIYSFHGFDVSWRDVILGGGGLFLLYKATVEIASEMRGHEHGIGGSGASAFGLVVFQIVLLDLVFSIDSIITAVGLSQQLPVMIAAVVVAILVMLMASGPVGEFIHRHPTVKMLALAFLLLVGLALVADAVHFHIDRVYLYIAIAFSLIIEIFNLALFRGNPKLGFIGLALGLVLMVCVAVALDAATMPMPATYFYVPAIFALAVQVLNRLAARARSRVAQKSA